MPLVTITGSAWDHNRVVVPPALRPRLGFRPLRTNGTSGLMTSREVWATTFNTSTGLFTVALEKGIAYVPFMQWLASASQADEAIPNRALGGCEWTPFTAWQSGSIDLQPQTSGSKTGLAWVSLSPPPDGFVGLWLLSDPSVTTEDTDSELGNLMEVG